MKKFALVLMVVAALATVSCVGKKAKKAAEEEVTTEQVECTKAECEGKECCAEGEECCAEGVENAEVVEEVVVVE